MKSLKLFVVVLLIPFELLSNDSKPFPQQTNDKKPNVIIIMTDDQGYGDLSYHGNPVLDTPNMDRLAEQSIRLTDFHVTPMCAPTRGQLLTGLDAARNGTVNVSAGRMYLRPDLPTMADIFAKSGYSTGIFGKWHLGDVYPYRPEDRGFDEATWFPSSHIGSVPDYWGNDYFDDTYIHNGERKSSKGYSTDIFFEEAMEFMRNSVEEEKPFFAYIPTNTPHSPLIAKDEDLKAMQKAFAESALSDIDSAKKDRLIPFLAMIRNIDTNMGRLMSFLEEEELAEDTILIFTMDNGSTQGPSYYNAGMRGMKTQLWEGGHRVAFFMRWPNGELGQPRDIAGLTTVQDVLPTLIDLTDIVPAAPLKFDGVNLAPVFRDNAPVPEDRMVVINYSRMPRNNYPSPYGQSIMKPEGGAVLWKSWRLLEDRALYNLDSDPLQQNNVIDQHPEIVEKMRKHLYDWWDEVESIANEPQRVVIGSDHTNPMRLTAVGWLDVFVDMQRQVLEGTLGGTQKFGYWLLEVAEAGEYEIELRRWPKEIDDVPLMESPGIVNNRALDYANAKSLPISGAQIYINNTHLKALEDIGPYPFLGLEKNIEPGDTSVTFNVKLEKGPVALHTWFTDEDGNPITSAFYVNVRRK